MSQTPSQEFEIQFKEFYHKEDQVMIYVKVQLLKSQEKCFLQEENNLQPLGGGNKKHTARAIAPEEVDVLFKSNYFGDSSPLSLQRTVWWFLTQHFKQEKKEDKCNSVI